MHILAFHKLKHFASVKCHHSNRRRWMHDVPFLVTASQNLRSYVPYFSVYHFNFDDGNSWRWFIFYRTNFKYFVAETFSTSSIFDTFFDDSEKFRILFSSLYLIEASFQIHQCSRFQTQRIYKILLWMKCIDICCYRKAQIGMTSQMIQTSLPIIHPSIEAPPQTHLRWRYFIHSRMRHRLPTPTTPPPGPHPSKIQIFVSSVSG